MTSQTLAADSTRPELTVHIDGSLDDAATRTSGVRDRLRRHADIALLGLVAAAVLIAVQMATPPADADQTPNAVTASPFRTPPSPPFDPVPKLVAPATAWPGQSLTVLGYQHRGLCATNEILLDNLPVATQQVATLEQVSPEWDGIILTLVIPPTTSPGPHVLALVGTLPGQSRGADTCVSGPLHRGLIAATPILIRGPGGVALTPLTAATVR